MKPKTFMLIAGEASGDMLAAELVQALRLELLEAEAIPTTDFQPLHASLEPRFFGDGGPGWTGKSFGLTCELGGPIRRLGRIPGRGRRGAGFHWDGDFGMRLLC